MLKRESETGVVSLMVTMVMMIVITLVVLGFAEIARNEQRSSLDDQLSVQAYYAAESGINDARSVINAAVAAGGSAAAQDKTSCEPDGNYPATGTIDASHAASYTCVLVNTKPTILSTDLGGSSDVIPLLSGGAPFQTITLHWTAAKGYTSGASGCYTNPTSLRQNPVAAGTGQWNCAYPMVRIDLLDANGSLSRASWNAATTTAFVVPFDASVATVNNSFNLGVHGSAVPASCDSSSCAVHITGVNGTKYYMRVEALYQQNSNLTISNAANAPFVDAQAIIDATGKAQDVLRRVQVAVDLTDANAHPVPSAAIITQDSICKRFSTTDTIFRVYDDLSAGGDGNIYCQLH